MKFQRIGYKEEPKLKLDRYVVKITRFCKKEKAYKSRFLYAQNRSHARKIKRHHTPVGAIVEVFKIDYNYHMAWQRLK